MRRNALFSSAGLSWGGLAFIGACLLLALRLLAPDVFWKALAPAFRASEALAGRSHAFMSSFSDTAALALENEKLVQDNATLALRNEVLEDQLDRIAGLVPAPGAIIAGVVARPPTSPYDTLVLAAGTEAGVAEGMAAFGEGGVPLGVVSSVQSNFSRVTLFSAPGTSVSGSAGAARVPLTIKGAGAGALHASVPRTASVAVGDTVFAPGPGDLALGIVVRIDSDPSLSSVTLRIVPAINLFSVTWVMLRHAGTVFSEAFPTTMPLTP